jgi:cysteine desulfurase
MDTVREFAWANPASVHRAGQRARAQLDRARQAVAQLVGLSSRDVILTSGGTEANNMALRQAFAKGAEGALVVGRIEHPSVTRCAESLQAQGVPVHWISPRPDGILAAEDFAASCDSIRQAGSRVQMIALQAVNQETGVLQPLREVARLALEHDALFHVDAVQLVGKAELAVQPDSVAVASHKIRGPKGIGALVTRPGVPLSALLQGGEQERGLRPGTADPIAAAGFAKASERACHTAAHFHQLAVLRDAFEGRLMALLGQCGTVTRNGTAPRLAHAINLSVEGWNGPELCAALDLEGVAISSGSACSAGTAEPSPVIEAMVGRERARSAIRISLGEDTTADELDRAYTAFEYVIKRFSKLK